MTLLKKAIWVSMFLVMAAHFGGCATFVLRRESPDDPNVVVQLPAERVFPALRATLEQLGFTLVRSTLFPLEGKPQVFFSALAFVRTYRFKDGVTTPGGERRIIIFATEDADRKPLVRLFLIGLRISGAADTLPESVREDLVRYLTADFGAAAVRDTKVPIEHLSILSGE